MPSKRQTIDAAALVRQAEQRGKEAGRRELAAELRALWQPGSPAHARDLRIWLMGRLSLGRDDVLESGVDALRDNDAVYHAILEALDPEF